VEGDDVGGGEQLVLLDPADADLGRPLVGEVLAPGHHVHLEGLPDPGDPRAEPAEAEDAEPVAREVGADGLLPPAGADRGVLLRHVPGDGEDQRPGQLGGAGQVRAGTADGDAALGGRGDVDGDVARAGGDQQLQVRQPLEHAAREGGALAHRDDDVEGLQAPDQRVLIPDVVGELHHLDRLRHPGPVGVRRGDVLVVVQDGDAMHGLGLLPRRARWAPGGVLTCADEKIPLATGRGPRTATRPA
jgi:hypothetical protein